MKKIEKTVLNQASTLILRLAIFAIGAIVLALCVFALPAIWRAVPGEYPSYISYAFYAILAGLYVAAIPFFMALFQALNLLAYIDKNKAFSKLSVKALRKISYCGLAIAAVFTAMLPFMFVWAEADDAPGLILIGMAFVGASLTVAVFAAVMQRLLRQAIDLKNENDLTV